MAARICGEIGELARRRGLWFCKKMPVKSRFKGGSRSRVNNVYSRLFSLKNSFLAYQ